jgi:hypothetical protein
LKDGKCAKAHLSGAGVQGGVDSGTQSNAPTNSDIAKASQHAAEACALDHLDAYPTHKQIPILPELTRRCLAIKFSSTFNCVVSISLSLGFNSYS